MITGRAPLSSWQNQLQHYFGVGLDLAETLPIRLGDAVFITAGEYFERVGVLVNVIGPGEDDATAIVEISRYEEHITVPFKDITVSSIPPVNVKCPYQ